tara:strand:- start:107 stop:787 length:681 start_codon:yes stop_codon:yes gene_type:complete
MLNDTLQLFVYKDGYSEWESFREWEEEIVTSHWATRGVAAECITCANNDPCFQWLYVNLDEMEFPSNVYYFGPTINKHIGCDNYDKEESLDMNGLVNKADFPEIQFVEGEQPMIAHVFDHPRYCVCFYRSNDWVFVVDVKTMEIKSGVEVYMDKRKYDFTWDDKDSLVFFRGDSQHTLYMNYAKDRVHHVFVDYVNKMSRELTKSERKAYLKVFEGGKNTTKKETT